MKQLIKNKEADNENDAAIKVIEDKYPSLYLYICWSFGEKKKMSEYMKSCEILCFGGEQTYSKYVHGYFMPWLDMQKSARKVKPCNSKKQISIHACLYT